MSHKHEWGDPVVTRQPFARISAATANVRLVTRYCKRRFCDAKFTEHVYGNWTLDEAMGWE